MWDSGCQRHTVAPDRGPERPFAPRRAAPRRDSAKRAASAPTRTQCPRDSPVSTVGKGEGMVVAPWSGELRVVAWRCVWRGRHEPAVLRPSAVADIFQVFVLIINTALVTPAPRICQAITWKIRRSPRRPGRRRAGSRCCSRTGGRKRQASWESPCELPARRPGSSWRSWSPKGSSRRRPSRRGSAVRRGRWSLTPLGNTRFPDAHSALAVDLITSLRQAFGTGGLDRLLALRAKRQAAAYRERLGAGGSLRARLQQLAEF